MAQQKPGNDPAPVQEPGGKGDKGDKVDEVEEMEEPKPDKEELLENEDAILRAFLDRAEKPPEKEIRLKRLGVKLVLRGLWDKEVDQLRERCETSRKDRRTGRIVKDIDIQQLANEMIVAATTNFNWGTDKLLMAYKASSPAAVVERALMAGEKDYLFNAIQELSGFEDDFDTAKN